MTGPASGDRTVQILLGAGVIGDGTLAARRLGSRPGGSVVVHDMAIP
jgi:hypothetical protein